jgi:hypothetical protein
MEKAERYGKGRERKRESKRVRERERERERKRERESGSFSAVAKWNALKFYIYAPDPVILPVSLESTEWTESI